MNTAKTLVILLICVLATESKLYKRCLSSDDCEAGECCARNRCRRVIPQGHRCNVVRQILGQQCPCAVGSTCGGWWENKITLRTRMTCEPLPLTNNEEMEENVINI